MDEDHVTEQPQTRDIPPMQMEARAMPGSWNEEGRSLEVVCSTSARVRRYDLWKDEEFNEEFSMIRPISVWGRFNNNALVCDSHATYSLCNVIGKIKSGTAQQGYAFLSIKH